MKIFTRLLSLFSLLLVYQVGISQCPDLTGTPDAATSPAACDCAGTNSFEYFVLDLETFVDDGDPDTPDGYAIVGSVANPGDPIDYLDGVPPISGCSALIPICYNLAAVQELIEGMNPEPSTCCQVINALAVPGVTVCSDIINAGFTGGSTVTNLTDLVSIFGAFGISNPTIPVFVLTADGVNAQYGSLAPLCALTAGSIAYCVNSEPLIVLSIEVTELSGQNMVRGNKLKWKTQSELNNEYFIIEKSKDGITFSEIGIVEGAGSSSVEIQYEFMDEKVSGRTNYYRVTDVDFNGMKNHSEVIAIKTTSSNTTVSVDIVPNPVKSTMTLSYDSDEIGEAQIFIVDSTGKNVMDFTIDSVVGYNEVERELSELTNGLYMAIIRIGDQSSSTKFLKL